MTRPYGEWASPVTAGMMTAESVRLSAVAIDGEDVYWLEGRPSEGGRNVLVRLGPFGSPFDVTPDPYSVRSRAHEYGGGAFLVSDGRVWFVNDADQRIYQLILGGNPSPLTPEGPFRYADMVLDKERNRLVCVRESHASAGEPVNEIVSIDLADASVSVTAIGFSTST